MKKHIYQNRKIYFSVFLLTIFVFSYYFIGNHGILLFYGDPFEINFKLWQGGWEAVHNGTFSQFTWSLGLGANTFSYVFYFLSNPFFWISCLLPKDFILYSFLFFQIITIILGFIICDCWLFKVTKNRFSAIIGSLMINFSAYMFFYLQADQFEKLFILYPFVLYFVECFIQDNKWKGLIPSIALLGLSHYYLLYLLLPFLSVYTIIRFIIVHKKITISLFLSSAIKFFVIVSLGILMSCVILIPCGYLITNMPRFTAKVAIPLTLSFKQVFKIFTSLFFPVGEKLNANPIISANQSEFYGWSGGCSLYSFILTLLLLPYLFRLPNKKEKIGYGIFLGLLLIFMIFPIFSYLFQISIDTRWYYMIVFYNSMICTIILSQIIQRKIIIDKSIWLYYLLIVITYITILILSFLFQMTKKEMLIQAGIISFALLLIGYLYTSSLYKCNYKRLMPYLFIEIMISGIFFSVNNIPIVSWAFKDSIFHTRIDQFLNAVEKRQNSFYRTMYNNKTIVVEPHEEKEDDTFTMMTGNEPYANGYAGFGFYESIYNTNQEHFLNRMKSTWNMTQMIGRTRTHNMLSAKYWYNFSNNDIRPVPYGYHLVSTSEDNGLSIYQNENYVELGYTYQNTINADFLSSLPYFEQDRIMTQYLATQNSTNKEYQIDDSILHIATLPSTDIRTYQFNQPIHDVQLYIENYGLPNAKITTYFKGKKVDYYDIWQFHYIDFPVYQMIDEIKIDAPALYGTPTEINLHVEPFYSKYDKNWKKQTATHFENVNKSNDLITAEITIPTTEEYVFTSIPYDKGWSVYIDGEKIDYEKVQFGFIGFVLNQGKHKVKFQYVTPGLSLGIHISMIGFLLYLTIIIFKKENKNTLS